MTTHEEKNLICDGCGKRFSNKMRLITHYRQSHWAAPLVCSTCGKKFKKYQNRALRLHEQKHHAHQMTKKNPCGICKNTFESSIIMFEHVRAVHFKSKMKCEHCETFFPRQEVYQDHVKAKHADIGPERIKKLLAKIDNIRADYEEMDWVYE